MYNIYCLYICTARNHISIKSNEAYGVHGETQDPATDYYENVLDESKAENETNTEGPLYESVTESGEGKDVYSEQLLGTRFDMCTYFILPHCT